VGVRLHRSANGGIKPSIFPGRGTITALFMGMMHGNGGNNKGVEGGKIFKLRGGGKGERGDRHS